jgi:DNA-directed RNA polymerase subunit omega
MNTSAPEARAGSGKDKYSVIEPKIEKLLEDVDSKYTLVILAAKRSRQINAYFSQLGEGVAEHTPPQVPMSPDQAPKALSISLQEIAEDKVGYERTSDSIK